MEDQRLDNLKMLLKSKDSKKKPKSMQDKKVEKVMREFKEGRLKSSSGKIVTDRKQAIAIAMSESGQARKATEKLSNLLKAKYIKRIPKPGGGYRYIYKEAEKKKNKQISAKDTGEGGLGFTGNRYKSVEKMRNELINDNYNEQAINRLSDDKLELAYMKFKNEELIMHEDYKKLNSEEYTKKEWAQLEKYKKRMEYLEQNHPSHYLDAAQTTELVDYELFSILLDNIPAIEKNLARREESRKAIGKYQGRVIEKRADGAEGRLEQALNKLKKTNKASDKLSDLLKAKYIRRWKGKDGKYRYEYAKPGMAPPAKSELKDKEKIIAGSKKGIDPDFYDVAKVALEGTPEQSFEKVKTLKDIPASISDKFREQYGAGGGQAKEAWTKFVSEVKAQFPNEFAINQAQNKQKIIEILSEDYKITDPEVHGSVADFMNDMGFESDQIDNFDTDVNDYGYELEVDGEIYSVMTESQAYEAAYADHEDIIEDTGITSYKEEFWKEHLDTDKLGEYFAEDSSHEYDYGYDEPDSFLDEEPAGEDGDWTEKQREKAGEMAEEQYQNRVKNDPIEYIEEIYGSIDDFPSLHSFVDQEALIKDAIKVDGIAHSLARYDHEEHAHGNYFFYRTD